MYKVQFTASAAPLYCSTKEEVAKAIRIYKLLIGRPYTIVRGFPNAGKLAIPVTDVPPYFLHNEVIGGAIASKITLTDLRTALTFGTPKYAAPGDRLSEAEIAEAVALFGTKEEKAAKRGGSGEEVS